ncbi:MAG: glycosyltransferase family 2 protein [Winogradskyella sp.]|uniref:glycosyltransferase family 2 protein n=1 Tax=Winogradskyella sp. TaxID=1883156 RepID=UPI000F3E47DF|nr:glycosyltransferase family 2 protein [Winogradskyella sp.]RNC84893.1 MAG: glycosyltransferase family 2 protein [Winogradskyella sp.]
MIKLSGVIITYNEERNIENCILSLIDVVDEIVVLDSYSTDNTKTICEKHNVKFFEQEFLGYVTQKNKAVELASYDCIVSLDGDESLSDELKSSIKHLKSNWRYDGYYCNRLNNFCGQWIKHSDWYPNKKLRVFDRRKTKFVGHIIHEKLDLEDSKTKVGQLKGDILHKTYQTYSEFNLQTEKFSTLSAQAYFEKGKTSNLWKMTFNPAWAFFKAYFLRLGFLDGINGFVICAQTANITFLKYSKLYELQKNNTK